jgi:hypothetical protein
MRGILLELSGKFRDFWVGIGVIDVRVGEGPPPGMGWLVGDWECILHTVGYRWLHMGFLGLLAVLVTGWNVDRWLDAADLRVLIPAEHYHRSLLTAFCWVVDGWAVGTIAWMVGGRTGFMGLWRHSGGWVVFCWLMGFLAMLALNPLLAGRLQGVRVMMPLGLLVLLTRGYYLLVVRTMAASRMRRFSGMATAVYGLLAIFMILEGVYMFVGRPHANNSTLASRVWFARHWQVNAQGFRDREWDFAADRGKRKLLLIGDSFVAGHGVAHPEHRFGDLLQARLGDGWRVYNLGMNGADTPSELEVLRKFPETGIDLLVFCWYVNDIDGQARKAGMETGNARPVAPLSLMQGSYFLNYFGSQWSGKEAGANYMDFLERAYADSTVRTAHLADLLALSLQGGSRFQGARACYVLFPMLQAVAGSEFAVDPVLKFLNSCSRPVLDLRPALMPYPAESLTVNASDAHPSEFAHRLAADAIWEFMEREELLKERP